MLATTSWFSVWLFIFSVRISSNRKSLEVGFPIDQVSKLNTILAATFPLSCTCFLTSIIEVVSLFILQCKYMHLVVPGISLQTQQSQTDVGIKRRVTKEK